MKHQKRVLFMLVIVVLAVVAFSANIVLAGDGVDFSSLNHPPVCYKIDTFGWTGYYELNCTDAGKDITSVSVKTTSKYEVSWDNEQVTIRFYPVHRHDVAYWIVQDKIGNIVSGKLP